MHNTRIICKHFNLSYIDLRDDISLADYLVMLAEAYEAELARQHEIGAISAIAYHKPKKLKGIKRQLDRLRNIRSESSVGQSILNFATSLTGGNLVPSGKAEDFAAATGRKIAYLDGDGRLFDRDGNPTVKDELTIVVPLRNQLH